MDTNNIVHSAIRLFFSAFTSVLVAIVLKILIINEFDLKSLGVYALFMAIYLFILGSISFQIVSSSSKFISGELNTKSRNKLITATFFLGFILSSLGFLIIFLLRLPIINYYGFEENSEGLTALAISLPIRILVNTTHGVFNGLQKYKYTANSIIIDRCSFFLIAFFVISYYGDFNLIFYSYLGSTFISLIYSLIVLKFFFKFDISGLYNNIKEIFWFGLKISSINWFSILGQHLDVFVLSVFVPIEILAIYSLALSFASFFATLFDPVGQIVLSEVSHLIARNDYIRINKLLSQTFRIMMSSGLLLWMLSLLLFEPFLDIIISEDAVEQVALIFYVLSVGFILRLTFNSLDISITAIGKPLKLFPLVFVPLCFRLCTYPLFLPLYGLISLVAIKFFAIMILVAMSYYLINKNIGFNIDNNTIIMYLAIICIPSLAKFSSTAYFNNSVIILLVAITLSFLIMLNSKAIRYEDYLFFKKLVYPHNSSKK